MSTVWRLIGGRLVDPGTGIDRVADLWIADGKIVDGATQAGDGVVREIDLHGKVVVPGFIDLHVHFREPGNSGAETVRTGAVAAAAGGFTTVVTMPNTTPPVDSAERVLWQREEGGRAGCVRVLPSGCLTEGRKGIRVADLKGMVRGGAVAFTDDGATVADETVMCAAMESSEELGVPVMDHALDAALARDGVMHAGRRSEVLGLPGIPAEAEEHVVARDVRLAGATGAKVHIQHLSTAGAIRMVRDARCRGERVSAEATPHHLALCDEDVDSDRPDAFKMNPPLGGKADRDALIEGVVDGTVTVFATDHAPHLMSEKGKGFLAAPFGVVGLETAVGVTFTLLVKSGRMSLMDWVKRWTVGPAEVLGLPRPSLAAGAAADIAVLDLESEWVVDPASFRSKGRNTPFGGWKLAGKTVMTFLAGSLVHRAPDA